MRIAMAQITGSSDPAANRKLVAGQVAKAAAGGARMVVFPEHTLRRSEVMSESPAPTAETLAGPFVSHISQPAGRHKITVMAGMTERIDGEQVRARNTVVVVDDAGRLIGSYRKIHLFDALGTTESAVIVPGDGSTLVFPLGEHVIGVATCYDLRFPELARLLVDRGANVLVYPSGWQKGLLKEEHWEFGGRGRVPGRFGLPFAERRGQGFHRTRAGWVPRSGSFRPSLFLLWVSGAGVHADCRV